METPYKFSERLAYLMDQTGLSKSQIADICGINRSNITRYLNGEYEAKQDVIYALATHFNVSPAWLLGYDVPMQDEPNPLPLNEKHILLNLLFDKLSPESQDLIIAQLQGAVRNLQEKDAR